MLVEQRREQILQTIEQMGFVSLQELIDRLGASESTVRRDLEHLDAIGQIRRTRGGATFTGDSITPFEVRTSVNLPQKQQIARELAQSIEPGDTVLLDGGTTTLEVARALIGKPIQVVTNSLPIAGLLMNQPSIELIFTGGYVYPKTGVALGPITVAALKDLRVRKLILSAGGVTEAGLFNSNTLLVEAERQMLRAADEVILAADSTKFGRSALTPLCPLSSVHRVVTDSAVSNVWRDIFEQAKIPVTVAPK